MQKIQLISKSMGFLFLGAVFYMHLCSAICGLGTFSCCGDKDDCKNELCNNDHKSEGQDHGCQSSHFSFFKAAGQFSSEKIAEAQIAFTVFIGPIAPFFLINPIETSRSNFAYNGFHPPPLNSDIRIFIQSFQI